MPAFLGKYACLSEQQSPASRIFSEHFPKARAVSLIYLLPNLRLRWTQRGMHYANASIGQGIQAALP
jgi:hypothetical protein